MTKLEGTRNRKSTGLCRVLRQCIWRHPVRSTEVQLLWTTGRPRLPDIVWPID